MPAAQSLQAEKGMVISMKILVTGAKGFIGKNLMAKLKFQDNLEVFAYDTDTEPSLLETYCREAEFVFHLAGVNRPKNVSEFMEGNFGFTERLVYYLSKNDNPCPIMYASSIQSDLDNDYGKSKKAAENLLFQYCKKTEAKVLIYQFPNIFGKWCRPNYNSVIATFCHDIAHDLPIRVDDPDTELKLAYIDDTIEELLRGLYGNETRKGDYCVISQTYMVTLGTIVKLLYSFEKAGIERTIPDMSDGFTKALYSTYTSYLPEDKICHSPAISEDNRGVFMEFIRTLNQGQISVNTIKPGYVKGNHWHHTKCEKFLVVSGKGVIRLRNYYSDQILTIDVSGDKMTVVNIPAGFIHNIENLGDTDMVTLIWANECFNPEKPDTYYSVV
ncbi:MAG: capsular biosynthesis protein [Herbinix sp.]|nr:capsular biosynthesis protein [Herbinix sp.]